MTIIPYSKVSEAQFRTRVLQIITENGIVIYPTDTLYGLGGNFFSETVHETIDRLKERQDEPYSVAVSGIAMLEGLVENIPDIFVRLHHLLLPGKFTFIFKAHSHIKRNLLKGRQQIGIRIPALPPILELISAVGFPLLSTSVNKSGSIPLNDSRTIARAFPEADLLIDAGRLPESLGSTVVDLSVTPPKIVRRGDDIEKIEPFL